MFATYTVSYTCMILYSLINIAKINVQTSYAFSKTNDAPKWCKIFLKNLLMSLMKEYFI